MTRRPGSETFDLVVVGAGIVGALAAVRAARRHPDWRILLVDREAVGGGATRASAALCIPFGRDERQREMERESDRFYRDLRRELPGLPVRDLPCFVVAREGSLAAVRERCTAGDLREMPAKAFPGLNLDAEEHLLGGLEASYAAAEAVTSALVFGLGRAAGVAVWEGVEILRVGAEGGQGDKASLPGQGGVDVSRPFDSHPYDSHPYDARAGRRDDGAQGDGVELTTADGRAISARRALLAPGPWALHGPSEGLARRAGVRIKKVVALHLDRCPAPDDPILYFFDSDAFLLPLIERGSDRRYWLFSFTCQVWDCAPEASQLRITAEDRENGLAVLARYLPEFAAQCTGGRVFCDAYGPEWVPIVTADPAAPRIVLATAGSGGGYRLGPALARQALDALEVAS